MSKITLLSSYDHKLRATLNRSLATWELELRTLLLTLPQDLTIDFDNEYLIPDSR